MTSDVKRELMRLATMVDHTSEQANEGSWVVRGNEAAQAYGGIQDTMDNYRTVWNASFTGAFLAGLFLNEGWLESFTMELYAEAEYDDQGGTYRSVYVRVLNATARTGAELPVHALDDDAEFSEDGACGWILDLVEDNAAEIYLAVEGVDSYDDVTLEVQRSSVASLLESGRPVSGLEAFAILFPEHAWRARTQAPPAREEPPNSPAQQAPRLEEYLFDARLLAAVRVRAASQEEARDKLGRLFDCARCHVEIDADSGESIAFEASIDGPATLIAVNDKS